MRRILALDLARTTGYAYWQPSSAKPIWGEKKFSSDLQDSLFELDQFVGSFIYKFKIDTIALEEPFVGKYLNNIDRLYTMRGIILKEIAKHNICRIDATPSEWRCHFLNFTNAPRDVHGNEDRRAWLKNRAKEKCLERGWKVKTDNEAEALGLLCFARSKIDPDYAIGLTPLGAKMNEVTA
jgi:hypothetical protein